MRKKRFVLAILLVAIFLLISSQVWAGCCQGIVGCSRAFFSSECSDLATFDSRECEEIQDCDIVACCHDIPGIPKATYRSTCLGMSPPPAMTFIKEFTTNPSAESAFAGSICAGAAPPCPDVNCDGSNEPGCMCGSSVTTPSSPFCCARDSSVFSDFGSCSASPSCRIVDFYSISGRVITPEGVPVEGAEVRAGGKQVLTDAFGNFNITMLADLSSGTAVAIKGSVINSTPYSIDGADVVDLEIVLDVEAAPPEGLEDCTNGVDDDGDQFFWDSMAEGLDDYADRCDSDCAGHFSMTLRKSVTKTYFSPRGEYFEDATVYDFCSDGFDNDCDGLEDCEDPDCFGVSPSCMDTFCGDGVVQFPNGRGIYEQCDYYSADDGMPIIDPDTGDVLGDDSLCPGQCIPPGEPRACTCQYEAVCGNGVIDEPLEDCDGFFLAARNVWDSANFNSGSDCTADVCGKPDSIRPCQCPPPQICGNGIKEGPEQCDNGFLIDPETGSAYGEASGNCDGCNPDCTCPPAEAVCGNNIIEYGEDCDGTINIAQNFWDGFKTRKFGCNINTCGLPESSETMIGWLHPSGTLYDAFDEYITAMPDIDTECTCPTSCVAAPPGPVLDRPSHIQWERAIALNWTDDCLNENARSYNVLRCTADGPGGDGCTEEGSAFVPVNEAPLGVVTSFIDTTVHGSTPEDPVYYCYFIQGVYGDMISHNEVVPVDAADALLSGKFNPDIHCLRVGMEQCFDFKEYYPFASEFCSGLNYNVRSTCDANNSIVKVTPESPDDVVDCNAGPEDSEEDEFAGEEPLEGEEGEELPEEELVDISNPFTEYICVGPYSPANEELAGKTQCVAKSVCDYCNDPFGIFGFSSSSGELWEDAEGLPFSSDFGSAPEIEPTDYERRTRFGYVSCMDLDFCYMDYSYTNTNKFFAYDTPTSCYDFNSQKACSEYNDTIGGGTCEWVWHPLFGELGVGVCRTNITEEQECDRCHDPHNEVFNRCDRESCALYGRCYYDRANLQGEPRIYELLAQMTFDNPVKKAQKESDTAFYRCTHEREIACENYDSQEDCIGSHSPYSIDAEVNQTANVVVNVTGNFSGKRFVKVDGSNRVTVPSDDFFGFGECQWVSPKFTNVSYFDEEGVLIQNQTDERLPRCMKNSDGSPDKVEFESRESSSRMDIIRASDCKGLPMESPSSRLLDDDTGILDCRKDFADPITNVPHYDDLDDPMRISGNFEFSATVFDESIEYSAYYPDTYGCVAEEGMWCYPNGTADKLGRDVGNSITYDNVGVNVSYNFSERGFQSGRHVIRYFSEDISHNLEPVRNFTVFLDADAPNMVFTFSNTSFEVSEDIWRTNLTMLMEVVPRPEIEQDDEFALCNVKMYLGNVSIYNLLDILDEYNNSWTRTYPEMPDDYYTLWYHCEDDVGNVAEENITLLIDGDKSLTNPQPRGTFNHGDHVINIETGTNAECRYLHSVEDLPEFWDNRTFDPALFTTMTRFEVTGSAESPTTIHRSPVSVGHGYHRYYVKCHMFNDDSYRGNTADQIRFAVDLEPPITTFSTNIPAYNSWYNDDVAVYLHCGDPGVMGAALDWSFGCNKSFYCKGEGCAGFEGEFREFDDYFVLNETTYITYYSVDKGGNEETPVEDVLFQVDKEEPEFTIEFFDGETPASVLVMNIVYAVRVTSSKPFISPAVEQPFITYDSRPSKFADTIRLLPTTDPSVWEGAFFLENINANRGYEGEGVFTVTGRDYHNVSGEATMTIWIDTNPPDMPVVEPALEEPSPDESDYQMRGYPLHYYNGTYYTNRASLFITGYTNEFLDVIGVVSVDGVDFEHPFTQTHTDMVYEDQVISGFVGQHEIKVAGDITTRANNSLFIGFDSEQEEIGPKTVYGEYGMFYDMTNLVYRGGDEQYTSLTIYPDLEESLKLDRKIFFYDKENPSFWFGLDVPLDPFRNNTFYLKAYDDALNLIRYPPISQLPPTLTFFSDPVPPEVINHFPRSGSTSRTTMDVGITVKEGKLQSGIYEDSINFTVNGGAVPVTMIHDAELEGVDPENYYYRIFYPASNLENDVYDVSITVKDLAMNPADETMASSSWTFEVDRSLPADPYFELVGGFIGPPGSDRWYVDHSPEFYVDFSDEYNEVTIVDVFMAETPTEGGAAACTETSNRSNRFHCVFTEPKATSSEAGVFWADYGVIVHAYKTLDDGTDSNTGEYGPFEFTVDDQAPDFTPAFQTRFRDMINLTVGAIVINENHPLYADMVMFGEHHVPLYSSRNGTFYYFVWDVPHYNKSYEGETNMQITLSDFAQNKRSITVPVYLDLTAPTIQDVTLDISHTVKIGTESFTKNPEVTISGDFIDDDIDKVWVLPGDYDRKTGEVDEKKYADLKMKDGIADSFEVTVRLMDPNAGKIAHAPIVYNYMLVNQINNMTLYFRDKAGHVSQRSLRVISDLAPPRGPTFCLGESWVDCVPSLGI